MQRSKLNTVWFGALIGTLVPVVLFLIFYAVFALLEETDRIVGVRDRTTALFAICANVIPLQIFKSKRWDDAMRGIVFPFLAMAGYWIIKYRSVLGIF